MWANKGAPWTGQLPNLPQRAGAAASRSGELLGGLGPPAADEGVVHSRHYTVRFPYVWPKSKMIWISSARHRHKFSTKNELRYVHHHIIQLAVGMTAPQHIYIYIYISRHLSRPRLPRKHGRKESMLIFGPGRLCSALADLPRTRWARLVFSGWGNLPPPKLFGSSSNFSPVMGEVLFYTDCCCLFAWRMDLWYLHYGNCSRDTTPVPCCRKKNKPHAQRIALVRQWHPCQPPHTPGGAKWIRTINGRLSFNANY